MRKLALLAVLVMAFTAIAVPASATKPGTEPEPEDGHKIWICHATRSLTNPYTKILIDSAAWTDAEDPDDKNDHGFHHTSTKEGITWSDYALESAEDECALDPPLLLCPSGDYVHYVIDFGTKLYRNGPTTQAVSQAVAAGTYDVILGSSDNRRSLPFVQPNERWRAAFSNGSTVLATTQFSTDLLDVDDPTGILVTYPRDTTPRNTVTVPGGVTYVLSQHWSVQSDQDNPNSVVPEYVCLVEAGNG